MDCRPNKLAFRLFQEQVFIKGDQNTDLTCPDKQVGQIDKSQEMITTNMVIKTN